MDNQQVSSLENFIKHPKYERLLVGNKGTILCSKTGRVRYTRVNKQGYMSLLYKINNKPKLLKVHRLVAECHLPNPSEELLLKCSNEHHGVPLVRHLDNNKLNNDVSNLEWCDTKTNNNQAQDDGLVPALKGVNNGRSTLTEDLVHQVCKFYEDGGTPLDAQNIFGISKSQSTKIRAGIQWKHIWVLYNIKVNRRKNFID